MCELLIHIAPSNTATDPTILAGQYAPGHVVAIEADGHPWTAFEGGAKDVARKVVKVPGVSEAAMFILMANDPPIAPNAVGVVDPTSYPHIPRLRSNYITTYATLPAVLPMAVPATWLSANMAASPLIANPFYKAPTVSGGAR